MERTDSPRRTRTYTVRVYAEGTANYLPESGNHNIIAVAVIGDVAYDSLGKRQRQRDRRHDLVIADTIVDTEIEIRRNYLRIAYNDDYAEDQPIPMMACDQEQERLLSKTAAESLNPLLRSDSPYISVKAIFATWFNYQRL